jgi:hypothetical protein
MTQPRRRSAAWIAILAMALQVVWPLVANAKPAQAALLVPLCTLDGVTHYVELPAGKPGQGDHAPAQHCKLCTFGADRGVAPAPNVILAVPAAAASPALTCATTAADRFSSCCLPPAPPRAPPALS